MRLLKLLTLIAAALALPATSFAAQSTPQSKQKQLSMQSPKAKGDTAHRRPVLITPRNDDSVEMFQRQNLDKGIYMPTYADGKSMCAAIMSYNFTPGDNPELKSVTTCTPAQPHSVYRTNDENRKRTPAPSLQLISSPQSLVPR